MAHYGKSLISAFQEFVARINKIFILAGRLGTRLSFYPERCYVISRSATREATRIPSLWQKSMHRFTCGEKKFDKASKNIKIL